MVALLIPFLTGCDSSSDTASQPGSETEKAIDSRDTASQPGSEPGKAIDKASLNIPEEMVLIPAGEFMMGDPSGKGTDRDHPQHKVSVDSFYMGKYEVTFEQYDLFCDDTGRKKPKDQSWGRGNRPVIYVSWYDAVAFCDWLSGWTGDSYRLPTEAEWEYACRAGTTTAYSFGDNKGDLGLYAWYDASSGHRTHPVGKKRANPWGLYDMHGNVGEWCQDWYRRDYYKDSPANNPKGPEKTKERIIRSGSWEYSYGWVRSANRDYAPPHDAYSAVGFRCVRDVALAE